MAIGCAVYIQQGASFEDFLVRAGVAAGVSLILRDKPPALASAGKTPVSDELISLREQLIAVEAMSDDEVSQSCESEFAAAQVAWAKRKYDREILRGKYQTVLGQVRAWIPPTGIFEADFERFKQDAVKVIEASISVDCDKCGDRPPVMQTVLEWRIERGEHLRKAIAHLEETAPRYLFMQALKSSLTNREAATN